MSARSHFTRLRPSAAKCSSYSPVAPFARETSSPARGPRVGPERFQGPTSIGTLSTSRRPGAIERHLLQTPSCQASPSILSQPSLGMKSSAQMPGSPTHAAHCS